MLCDDDRDAAAAAADYVWAADDNFALVSINPVVRAVAVDAAISILSSLLALRSIYLHFDIEMVVVMLFDALEMKARYAVVVDAAAASAGGEVDCDVVVTKRR